MVREFFTWWVGQLADVLPQELRRSAFSASDALVITERTTESHLSHIFAKLDLRSRTQLATWCIESGLLSSEQAREP